MYDVLGKMQRESRKEGWNEGRGEGLATGLASAQTLMSRMFSEGRVDDLRRASTDSAYLNQLLAEQGLLGEDTEPLATS